MILKGKITSYPKLIYNDKKDTLIEIRFLFYTENSKHIKCLLKKKSCRIIQLTKEFEFQALILTVQPFVSAIICGEKLQIVPTKDQEFIPDFIFNITEFIIIEPEYAIGTREIILASTCFRKYWLKYIKGASKKYWLRNLDALKRDIWIRLGKISGNIIHETFLKIFNLKIKNVSQLDYKISEIINNMLAMQGLDLIFYILIREKFDPSFPSIDNCVELLKNQNLHPQIKRYLSTPFFNKIKQFNDFEEEVFPNGIFSLYGQIDLRSIPKGEIIEIKTTNKEKIEHELQVKIYLSASAEFKDSDFASSFPMIGYLLYTQLKEINSGNKEIKLKEIELTYKEFLRILNIRNTCYSIRTQPIFLPVPLLSSDECNQCNYTNICRYYCGTERRWDCQKCRFLNECSTDNYDYTDINLIDKFNKMRKYISESEKLFKQIKKIEELNPVYRAKFHELNGSRTQPLEFIELKRKKFPYLAKKDKELIFKLYNLNLRDNLRIIRSDGKTLEGAKLIGKNNKGFLIKSSHISFFSKKFTYRIEKKFNIKQQRSTVQFGIDLYQRKIFNSSNGFIQSIIPKIINHSPVFGFNETIINLIEEILNSKVRNLLFDLSQGCLNEEIISEMLIRLKSKSSKIHLIIYSTRLERQLLGNIRKRLKGSIQISILNDLEFENFDVESLKNFALNFKNCNFLCLNSHSISKQRLNDFFIINSMSREEYSFERIIILSGSNISEPIYYSLLPLTNNFLIVGDSQKEIIQLDLAPSVFNQIIDNAMNQKGEIVFQKDYSFKLFTPTDEYSFLIFRCNYAPFILPGIEILLREYGLDLKSTIKTNKILFKDVEGEENIIDFPDKLEVIKSNYRVPEETELKSINLLIYAKNYRDWLRNYDELNKNLEKLIDKCLSKRNLKKFIISNITISVLDKEKDSKFRDDIEIKFFISLKDFKGQHKKIVYNESEIKEIKHFLLNRSFNLDDLVITTPFPQQIEQLRKSIWVEPKLQSVTIDLPKNLYGRIFNIEIISMVVSNDYGYIEDDLLELSLIYQLFSHSRDCLLIFGNENTLNKSYFFKRLIDIAEVL